MFKVGDFLVYKDSNKYKNCLFKVVDDEDAVAIAITNGRECFVYFADMRLAEPEEIALGHRIESSNSQAISGCSLSDLSKNESQSDLSIKQDNQDMGDDSHIENHISPNCKQVK